MYAQITSESMLYSGKTMRVFERPSGLQLAVANQGESLILSASERDRENSGDRGGVYNPITRSLHLELEKDDILKLLTLIAEGDLCKKIGLHELPRTAREIALESKIEELNRELVSAREELRVRKLAKGS